MAATDYETVIELARRLPPEKQRQLRAELVTSEPEAHGGGSAPPIPPARPLTEDERAQLEAWFVAADELATKIGTAWKDDMNAVDAVKEQRRDL